MEDFLEGYESLEKFSQEALKTIAFATKCSNALPSERPEDWDYYSSFTKFRKVMETQSVHIESMISRILKYNGVKASLASTKSVPEMLELLAEANDQILETIGIHLDDASGIKKSYDDTLLVEVSQSGLARISGSWNKNTAKSSSGVKLLTAKNVQRPQLNFSHLIDNSTNCFVPRLTEKPHSKKPLSILIEYAEDGTEFYSHPYLFELDHFKVPDCQFNKTTATKVSGTPKLVFVNSLNGLTDMVQELRNETEIGVDVEHHHYRSYLGITCLVQISSPDFDYVIDPFPMWEHMTMLNEIFANPKCVKILHGAGGGDVKWLQRDFSVYFVNVFDSYLAAKTLGFPRGCLSLAYLLHKYCGVKLDKRYQLADWRMRPLPDEMIAYARSDTSHLIELFHLMKDELLTQGNDRDNLLMAVYHASNDQCKFRYEKPSLDPKSSYLDSLSRSRANLNSRQVYAYKELFNWRDEVARTQDESLAYVLPPHMLLKVCTELPREMQGILACCNPVPPLVKQNLNQIHKIISRAREQELMAVPAYELQEGNESFFTGAGEDNVAENPLRCPLDLSNFHEEKDGLQSLLNGGLDCGKPELLTITMKRNPSVSVFSSSDHRSGNRKPSKDRIKTYLSPFQRFKMVGPFLAVLDQSNNVGRTDEDRIKSIKAHFDALAANTAQCANEDSDAKEDVAVEEEPEEGVEEPYDQQNLDDYDPEPEAVKNWRESKSKKNNKRKKKGANDDGSNKVVKVDFDQADFSQYSGGVKERNPNEFDPTRNAGKFRKGQNGKGRQKQRYKAGTRTFGYRKR